MTPGNRRPDGRTTYDGITFRILCHFYSTALRAKTVLIGISDRWVH